MNELIELPTKTGELTKKEREQKHNEEICRHLKDKFNLKREIEAITETAKEASARAIKDHNKITSLNLTLAKQAERIAKLEAALIRLRDCDWVVTWADRMDAVRDIAKEALED